MPDTIFAPATAPGKAGLAVIRISGPAALDVLKAFGVSGLEPRRTHLRTLRDADGAVLDKALVLTFEEGASFTGETTVELHLHGSIAVQRAVADRLASGGLARLAEPGEFTKRALLNGRMDMTEVQGLSDVIEAETEMQRQAAMRVLDGEMSERIRGWRTGLIRAAALLEATIDFADEEVPEDVWPEVRSLLSAVLAEFDEELAGYDAARSLREGFEVAIVGAPNVGKSSLLNYIVRGDAALVSAIPGTTRDVIERAVDLGGLKVTFVDTAGLRETDDPIESMGVDLARRRARKADLRLFLYDEEHALERKLIVRDGDLVRRTKADLHGTEGISSKTGAGVSQLLAEIEDRLTRRAGMAGFVSREHDRRSLMNARDTLTSLLHSGYEGDVEILVAELRAAIVALERIVGLVGVEDVLDEVFRSFCLGK